MSGKKGVCTVPLDGKAVAEMIARRKDKAKAVDLRRGPKYRDLGGLECEGPPDETYEQATARFEADLPELATYIGPKDKRVQWQTPTDDEN